MAQGWSTGPRNQTCGRGYVSRGFSGLSVAATGFWMAEVMHGNQFPLLSRLRLCRGQGCHGRSCPGRRCSQAEPISSGDSLRGGQRLFWVSPNFEGPQVAREHKLMEKKKNFQAETLASTGDKMCFDYRCTNSHGTRSLERDVESIIMSYQT